MAFLRGLSAREQEDLYFGADGHLHSSRGGDGG